MNKDTIVTDSSVSTAPKTVKNKKLKVFSSIALSTYIVFNVQYYIFGNIDTNIYTLAVLFICHISIIYYFKA